MKDSHGNIFVGETVLDTRQTPNKKTGRNSPCPCGSGIKFKRCHGYGGYMSTGIRSDNSTFTVEKATIIADTGVDLKNGSNGHINELNHISPITPNLAEVLKNLPVQPPVKLVQDAITRQKATGTIEDSELRAWFDKQGVNLAFWAQLAVAIAAMV
ncbi:YecA family protein [Pseudomonas sp. BF-B-25]|uniref:YecA family protein n=1 Tax=Pseudomonas sp. BF-B-25 TaxID=2832355 RepID=UPI001CBB4D7C|nr:SEC-C domain-containing protein [Pseudomonas sp. BF-B-25]